MIKLSCFVEDTDVNTVKNYEYTYVVARKLKYRIAVKWLHAFISIHFDVFRVLKTDEMI